MHIVERYPTGTRVVLALIGIVVVLLSTRSGVGTHPDSTVYIGAARNLMAGRGLTVPFDWGSSGTMTLHGPLFPALLAGIGMLGIDPLEGARWLNALLFAANILLVGHLISRYAGGAPYAAVFGSFLVLASLDVVGFHVSAMSEPTFLFFYLLGIYLLALSFEKTRMLPVAAAAIALASLARYAGVMMVVTGVIGILYLSRRPLPERVRNAVVFAGIGALPLLLWVVIGLYGSGSAAGREVVFHPIAPFHVTSALFNASAWLVPPRIPGLPAIARHAVALVAIAGVTLLGVLLLQRRRRDAAAILLKPPLRELPFLLVTFVASYIGLLVVYISFLDWLGTVGARIIAPVFVSGVVLVLGFGHRLLRADGVGTLRIAAVLVCVVLAASYVAQLAPAVVSYAREGAGGYANTPWRESDIIRQVKALPASAEIYSNGTDAIYILTGRYTLRIPAKTFPLTGRTNTAYDQQLATMTERLNRGAVVVYLDRVRRWYLPSDDELKTVLPLRPVLQARDGAIYDTKR